MEFATPRALCFIDKSRAEWRLLSLRLNCTAPLRTPGASEQTPPHQEPSTHVWQYPSEQMFFNAMKRKGWDAKEEDMHSVVAIHNSVNERAWQQVCQYEVWAPLSRVEGEE